MMEVIKHNNKLEDIQSLFEYSGGVEEEFLDEESYVIENPYDPNKVQFEQKSFSLDILIKRLQNDEINLNPDFQRLPGLWNKVKQSQFIESLLLRIPIPAFYFDGKNDGKWEVIDGLQRITTLKNFILNTELIVGNMILSGLEYLTKYNGYTYKQLPRDLQRRIDETQITVYIMREDTPDQVKFNVFKRINTGGLNLEPQEIRHALNQGIPAEFIKELATLDEFSEAISYSVKCDRMKDRDLVTRFVSFYQFDYKKYKPNPDLDGFLNNGMSNLKLLSQEYRDLIKEEFRKSMILSKQIFDRNAFRKISKDSTKLNPINKALFESISVTLARIDITYAETLVANKDKIITDFIELCDDDYYNKSISYATADTKRVQYRFKKIQELFNKYLVQ